MYWNPYLGQSGASLCIESLNRILTRIIGFVLAYDEDRVLLTTENGHTEIVEVKNLRLNDRYTNGSFLYDENEVGKTISIQTVIQEPKKQDKA